MYERFMNVYEIHLNMHFLMQKVNLYQSLCYKENKLKGKLKLNKHLIVLQYVLFHIVAGFMFTASKTHWRTAVKQTGNIFPLQKLSWPTYKQMLIDTQQIQSNFTIGFEYFPGDLGNGSLVFTLLLALFWAIATPQ